MASGLGNNIVLAEASINPQARVTTPTKYEDLSHKTSLQSNEKKYKLHIVWKNVIVFLYLHLGFLYGVYLIMAAANWKTTSFALFFAILSGIGITAGAHRLWAHKAYKAKMPLRILLGIFQTMAFQNHIYEWARDHRVHHKFSETDADPHNAKRGFFFSHIGWLMVKKHPDVKEKGKLVDMSDLEKDPVVMFQKRHYMILMPLMCFIVPTIIPWYFWQEKIWVSWYVAGVMRFTLSLNMTWLVNSAAHIWGNKPYDRYIGATDNLRVALGAVGEGWHNYHHTFPWDYKAAELGNYRANLTTGFIDFFSLLGWAYDMKTVSESIIRKRVLRTGDGTHQFSQEHSHEGQFWGWGDKDMTKDDMKCAEIVKTLN